MRNSTPLWFMERDITTFENSLDAIFKATTSPGGTLWMWTLAYGDHEDRTPTHGYEATRQAAMQAFARSLAQRELTVVTRRC